MTFSNDNALRRNAASFTVAVLMFSATVNGMFNSHSSKGLFGGLTPEEFFEAVTVNYNDNPVGKCTNLNYRGVPIPTRGSPRYVDEGKMGAAIMAQMAMSITRGLGGFGRNGPGKISPMKWARQKYGPNAPMRTIQLPGLGPMQFFNVPLPQECSGTSGQTETVGVNAEEKSYSTEQNDPEFTVQNATDPGVSSKAQDVFMNGSQVTSNKENAGVLRSIENVLGDNLLGMSAMNIPRQPLYAPRQAPSNGPLGSLSQGLGYKPFRPTPVRRTDGRGDALGQKRKAIEEAPAEDKAKKAAVEATWRELSGRAMVGTKIRYVTNGKDKMEYDCALQYGTGRVGPAYRFKLKETAEGKKARDPTAKRRKEFQVVMSDEHEKSGPIDNLTITQKEQCPSVNEKN